MRVKEQVANAYIGEHIVYVTKVGCRINLSDERFDSTGKKMREKKNANSKVGWSVHIDEQFSAFLDGLADNRVFQVRLSVTSSDRQKSESAFLPVISRYTR